MSLGQESSISLSTARLQAGDWVKAVLAIGCSRNHQEGFVRWSSLLLVILPMQWYRLPLKSVICGSGIFKQSSCSGDISCLWLNILALKALTHRVF